MQMTIKTYWESVDRNSIIDGLHPVIKGQYELKPDVTVKKESGWKSIDEYYQERCKGRDKFLGRDGNDFKHDLGTQYGIHSYQVVTLEEVPC